MKRPSETWREGFHDQARCRCLGRGRGPDRFDAGGRAGAGGRRRCHCRTAREPGSRRLARGRPAFTQYRGARSARDRRSVSRGRTEGPGRAVLRRRFEYQRLSDPASLLARALAEPHRAHPGRLGRRARRDDPSRKGSDRLRAGRHRCRRRTVRRPVAAGAVSRRLRRRAQPGPQGSRHRIPRVGSDNQQPDRRGRAGRGAGIGHAPGRPRHPWPRQGGVRDPRWRGNLRG